MIFLGATFWSDGNSLFSPVVPNNALVAIQINNGTYNQLYLTTNTDMPITNLNNEWDEDTKLNAFFDNTFDAGNTGFSLRNTDYIVVKRRESGTMDWTVIYAQEVKNINDLNINIIDKYARSGVEYEYTVSSFVNGVENSYIINNVYSEFNGFYVTDKDCLYGTIYNIDGCDTTRNTTSELVEMLNSKYMQVVSNSKLNCDSGSISGTFFELDDENETNAEASLQYRKSFIDRLANKKPLILKVNDGRIWMIKVTGTPSDNMHDIRDIRDISFEWTEIGDINDMRTLYLNGLSDVDSRWW